MGNLIIWLEKQIEGCDDLGGMEKEKWAFIQTLKKVRKDQLTSCCICEIPTPEKIHGIIKACTTCGKAIKQ